MSQCQALFNCGEKRGKYYPGEEAEIENGCEEEKSW